MIDDLQDRELVFLVGCARSGTTWLQLLLSQHPRVSTSQETNLFNVYMGPMWSKWQEEISNKHVTGLNTLLVQGTFLDLCRRFSAAVLDRIARVSGEETIILEKTPGHVFHAEFILQLFPKARFIHLVRRPESGDCITPGNQSIAGERLGAAHARQLRSTLAAVDIGGPRHQQADPTID